jgi:hypothetical protein
MKTLKFSRYFQSPRPLKNSKQLGRTAEAVKKLRNSRPKKKVTGKDQKDQVGKKQGQKNFPSHSTTYCEDMTLSTITCDLLQGTFCSPGSPRHINTEVSCV